MYYVVLNYGMNDGKVVYLCRTNHLHHHRVETQGVHMHTHTPVKEVCPCHHIVGGNRDTTIELETSPLYIQTTAPMHQDALTSCASVPGPEVTLTSCRFYPARSVGSPIVGRSSGTTTARNRRIPIQRLANLTLSIWFSGSVGQ